MALAATIVTIAAVAVLAAGCGSSSPSTAASGAGPARGHGNVDLLYAASLEDLVNRLVAPAFHRATGYTLRGYPAGSKDLANEIKGGIRRGDVFISASPKVNAKLEGAANGGWVSWYAPFASTSLVLGYNPHSSFAAQLRTRPWYAVIAKPGLRLGFTDPKLDPKGQLAVAALQAASSRYGRPALARIASDQSDLFPEQDLVGRLQAGELDAGLFYTVEASAAKIPTVSLAPVSESASYTITVLHRAPDPGGAVALVRFLLGPRGRSLLRSVGLTVIAAPRATGSGLPATLHPVIRAPR
ncbi:MAG: substrate-binding domain-containing protein [Solirubrobacteraceae bacterium]